jgi:hypothetical protein
MKREMDLIRLLLLEVESGERPEGMKLYSEQQVLYHCELAIEAGLLDGLVVRNGQGEIKGARLNRLKWEGHEFLDAARADSIWNQAKKRVIEVGGTWTMEGLKALLADFAKRSMLGE